MVKKTNGTKSPMNTGAFKRVFSVLVLLLLASVLMVGSGSAAESTAYVSNFDELKTALLTDKNTTIVLEADITANESLQFSHDVTIEGNYHTITADNKEDGSAFGTCSDSRTHLFCIGVGNTALNNITFELSNIARGLNTYNTNVDDKPDFILKNVIINESEGSGLTVKGTNLTATNLTIKNSGWKQSIDTDISSAIASKLEIDTLEKLMDVVQISDESSTDGQIFVGGSEVKPTYVFIDEDGHSQRLVWTAEEGYTDKLREYTKNAFVAQIESVGEPTALYPSLKAAFTNAEDGDTVTQIKDAEISADTTEGLVISKDITLNGNGYSITVPQIFIKHAGVTIDNITLNQNAQSISCPGGVQVNGVGMIVIQWYGDTGAEPVTIQNSRLYGDVQFTQTFGISVGVGEMVDVIIKGNTISNSDNSPVLLGIDFEAQQTGKKHIVRDNIIIATYHVQFIEYGDPVIDCTADIAKNYWGKDGKGVEPVLGISWEYTKDLESSANLLGADLYYTDLKTDGTIDTSSLTSKVTPDTQIDLTMTEGTTETSFIITDSSYGTSTITFDSTNPTEMSIDYGVVEVTIETKTPITQISSTTTTYVIPAGSTITADYPETSVAPEDSTAAGTMTYDLAIGLNTVVKDLPVITSTFDTTVVDAVDDANEHVDVFGMISGEYPQGSTTSNDNVTQVTITFKIPTNWHPGANLNKFVVYHVDANNVATPCTITERNTVGGFHVIKVIGNGFSSYAVGYDTYVAPQSSGSTSSSGSSVWLQEPTTQPTEQPTATPTPTETVPTDTVPTDIPSTQPTEQPSSPGFGILAALAGLGAVAVLRRK